MTVIINGTTGIDTIQDGTVTSAKIVDATIVQADLAIEASSIGVGQTWQDVLASRAASATYTNSTGKPIMVAVRSNASAAGSAITLTIDGLPISLQQGYIGGADLSVTGIVPAGSTYSVTVGGSLVTWHELR